MLFAGQPADDRRRRVAATSARSRAPTRDRAARGVGTDRVLGRSPRARCGSSISPAAQPLQIAARRAGARRSRRRPTAAGSRSPASEHLLLLDRTSRRCRRRGRRPATTQHIDVVGRLAPPRRADRRRARRRRRDEPAPTICRASRSASGISVALAATAASSARARPASASSRATRHEDALARPEHTLGVYEGAWRRDHRRRSRKARSLVLSDDGDHTLACPAARSPASRPRRAWPWIVAAARRAACSCGTSTRSSRAASPSAAEQREVRHRRSGDRDVARRARRVDRSARTRKAHAARHRSTASSAIAHRARWRARRRSSISAHHALARRRHGEPQRLDGEVTAAAFVDDHRLVDRRARRRCASRTSRPRTKLALYAHDAAARRSAAIANDGGVGRGGVRGRPRVAQALASTASRRRARRSAQAARRRAASPTGVALAARQCARCAGRSLTRRAPTLARRARARRPTSSSPRSRAYQLVPAERPGRAAVARRGVIDGGLVAGAHRDGRRRRGLRSVANWRWPLATPHKGQSPYRLVEIRPTARACSR